MKIRLTWMTALVIMAGLTRVSGQFSLSGEIRPRAEYRHGYRTLASFNQDPAFFVDQRTRINFDYNSKAYLFKVSIQDVRTWGSEPQLVANDGNRTTIHEAWGEIKISQKFRFKLGRQEIIYDDHRIFGNVGWLQQARSHDTGIFKYVDSTFSAHVGLAYNQDKPRLEGTLYTVPNSYKTFQYLWLHKQWRGVQGSFLFLNNGRQVESATDAWTNFSQTIGTRIVYDKNRLLANFELYYQTGEDRDTLNTKISAPFFALGLYYKLSQKFTTGVGFEMASGNDQVEPDDKNQAFVPLYGTNHKFYGLMDYFYVGNHIRSVGLRDLFLRLGFAQKKFKARADLHFFSSDGDILDREEEGSSGNRVAMNSRLGTELDLTFGYAFTGGVNVQAGYSQMFATNSMVALKGGDKDATHNWAWLMITLKPNFIQGNTED